MLPVATGSFGGIGVFAIPEMGRFYRHVLVQKRYPHHGAVAFGDAVGAECEAQQVDVWPSPSWNLEAVTNSTTCTTN